MLPEDTLVPDPPDESPTETEMELEPENRRISSRRHGLAVPVWLASGSGAGPSETGTVVDRSRDGLGILARVSQPTGTLLRLRPRDGDDLPWLLVRVRNCRRRGGQWLLGCQLVPPSSTRTLAALS
jgi:hypothetical protein